MESVSGLREAQLSISREGANLPSADAKPQRNE